MAACVSRRESSPISRKLVPASTPSRLVPESSSTRERTRSTRCSLRDGAAGAIVCSLAFGAALCGVAVLPFESTGAVDSAKASGIGTGAVTGDAGQKRLRSNG